MFSKSWVTVLCWRETFLLCMHPFLNAYSKEVTCIFKAESIAIETYFSSFHPLLLCCLCSIFSVKILEWPHWCLKLMLVLVSDMVTLNYNVKVSQGDDWCNWFYCAGWFLCIMKFCFFFFCFAKLNEDHTSVTESVRMNTSSQFIFTVVSSSLLT